MSFVSAYQGDEGNVVVSIPEAFAKSAGLKTLKEPATDRAGRPLPPREGNRTSASKAASSTNRPAAKSASKPEEGSE